MIFKLVQMCFIKLCCSFEHRKRDLVGLGLRLGLGLWLGLGFRVRVRVMVLVGSGLGYIIY